MKRFCLINSDHKPYTDKRGYECWFKYRDGYICGRCNQVLKYERKTTQKTPEEKRQKNIEGTRKWSEVNTEYHRSQARKNKQNNQKLWGSIGLVSSNDPIVIKSESFAMECILNNGRFHNVILTRNYSSRFPCDIMAYDENNKLCLIDVKLRLKADIPSDKMKMLRHMNARIFIIHIKPDFTFHHLNEITNGGLHSSALIPLKTSLGLPTKKKKLVLDPLNLRKFK